MLGKNSTLELCFYLLLAILKIYLFLYVYKHLFCLLLCMCAVSTVVRKKVLGPLELELQVVMNHHMGDGNLTQVCFKINHCWSLQPRLLKVVTRYLFILKADIVSLKR